jgi:uncharacterized protein (TIGR03083 family)
MTTDTALIAARIPQTSPRAAARAVEAEQRLILGLLSRLAPEDWDRPTDCSGWTVRDLVAHMLGQCEEGAAPRLLISRLVRAARRYPTLSRLDAHNRVQIDDVANLTPAQLVSQLASAGPRALHALEHAPRVLRPVPGLRLFGDAQLPDQRLAYLWDVLVVRDPWMHRLDLCRATNQPIEPAEHDALVVGQVVRDLARTWHGPAVTLELTGAVHDRWVIGTGTSAATVRADALDYCRILSGRGGDRPVEKTGDPDAATALTSARVEF